MQIHCTTSTEMSKILGDFKRSVIWYFSRQGNVLDSKTRNKTVFCYIVFEDLQGIDGGDENGDHETCRNCAALQEELELCKAKAAQDLQCLKEEMAEERKRNDAERDVLERKVLKLNNELSDVRRELEQRPTSTGVHLYRPTGLHPCTSGPSIVATSINDGVGMYLF